MKLLNLKPKNGNQAAAFRRLCIETILPSNVSAPALPAAFRRLCIETSAARRLPVFVIQPPSGGCVLKLKEMKNEKDI